MKLSLNQKLAKKGFIVANWPAADHVHALVTTRQIPDMPTVTSLSAADNGNDTGFNLALHTGGEPSGVEANRQWLIKSAALPASPCWLNQLHGSRVVCADSVDYSHPPDADACFTQEKNSVCAVMTADCLPVFFCNRSGSEVAVAHAGWRGLYAGVLEQTVATMNSHPQDLLVWFGPAIGAEKFELGAEVFQTFYERHPAILSAFEQTDASHYLCNIYRLAQYLLEVTGVTQFYGGDFCTCSQPELFYSYRRDRDTGRMASLIWIT